MLNRMLGKIYFSKKGLLKVVLGCILMAFTLVNIHMQAEITEGGVIGFTLFSYKIFGINPAIAGLVIDFACFSLGISMFGKKFLWKTAVASVTFGFFYKLFLFIGPVIPSIYDFPFLCSIIGGLGIGIGCGLEISEGGASGGDDALALIISKKSKISIGKAYLVTDFVILGLSITYIPFIRLIFSVLTTMVSSFIIERFENGFNFPVLKKLILNT
ncbi:MAG: YitT family protein [Peptoniphilaceae bacterium]